MFYDLKAAQTSLAPAHFSSQWPWWIVLCKNLLDGNFTRLVPCNHKRNMVDCNDTLPASAQSQFSVLFAF